MRTSPRIQNFSYRYDISLVAKKITEASHVIEIIKKCKHAELDYIVTNYATNTPEKVTGTIEISNETHAELLAFLKKYRKKYSSIRAFHESKYLRRFGDYSSLIMYLAYVARYNKEDDDIVCTLASPSSFFYYIQDVQNIILHTISPLSFLCNQEIILLL